MQEQELEQKNITISGIEDVQWGIKIKSETGEVFNIPKTLKGTQNETKAFQVLKVLPGYGMGMKKSFKFATVPNSQGGQSRYVRIISESEENAQSTTQAPKTSNLSLKSPNLGSVVGKQTNQSDDIRANVALKMVSEILAAGVIPLDQWQIWANNFYAYKPSATLESAEELDKFKASLNASGLTKSQEDEINLSEPPF